MEGRELRRYITRLLGLPSEPPIDSRYEDIPELLGEIMRPAGRALSTDNLWSSKLQRVKSIRSAEMIGQRFMKSIST
jgi:hypothetical protein